MKAELRRESVPGDHRSADVDRWAAPPGPLRDALMASSEERQLAAGSSLIEHHHRADCFFFLLEGEVEFRISLASAERDLPVGRWDEPGLPLGWSAFRPPHRYGTTVVARSELRVLSIPCPTLNECLQKFPREGAAFLEEVFRRAYPLLVEARRRLTQREHPEALALEAARRDLADASSPDAVFPKEEAMVTNAAPEVRELLARSAFFESFDDQTLSLFADHATTEYFCRGDELQPQGRRLNHLTLLADGKVRTEHRTTKGELHILGFHSDPGEVLGGGLVDWPSDVGLRATRDGALVRISRAAIEGIVQHSPQLGIAFRQRMLWLLSARLRATRARLVSEEFEHDTLAIESLIEQTRTELSVASPLHKLPHLLRSTLTSGDALDVVDQARVSSNPVERTLGKAAHELLRGVRREHRFFCSLQSAYEDIVGAPADIPAASLRRRNAENFQRLFSQIPHRIIGLERLPSSSGHIFVFNHLKNHEYNTLPNGFQLTLDSHFIASMILHRAYLDPGVRVVRKSRAAEYGHQSYYDRLGHISVYTRESDLPSQNRSERLAEFVATASAHLRAGTNLVLAPEGTSAATEESPGRFKAGAFRLAASIQPEPYIVPIAVAHFDRRLDHTTLCAVVHEPFRLSERLTDPNEPAAMSGFLGDFQKQFIEWVREASTLATHARHPLLVP